MISLYLEKAWQYDILLQILSGIICTLLGYFISVKIRKPQCKNDYTFCTLTALVFSGTITFLRETAEFFIDFFFGTNFLKCEFVGDDYWLFKVFGPMKSLYEERALFDTDEDMGFSLISSLIVTGIIYLAIRLRHKELFLKDKKKQLGKSKNVFENIKDKCKRENEKLWQDCSIFDVLFWWGTRAVMLYAFFDMEVRAEANLLFANLVGTFAVTIIHFIFHKDSFFSKISYRVQSLLVVIIFLGSYVGNYVFVYNIIGRYDLFLHFISGTLCVLGGYYVAKTLIDIKDKKDVITVSVFSFFFSCMIMPFWEFTEFIGDYIWGTSSQGFYWGPTEDSFFFKLFGFGAGNTELYYLFDTFYDILLAFSTTVPTAVILGVFLYIKIKKEKRNSETAIKLEEKTTVKC